MAYFEIALSPDGPFTQKEEQLIYFWVIDENTRQQHACWHQACRAWRAEEVRRDQKLLDNTSLL